MRFVQIIIFILVITSQILAQINNITVEITNPSQLDRFDTCEDIKITADVSIQSGQIDRVYFYADGKYIGFDRDLPYELDWNNVPTGIFELTAEADTAVSDPITIFVDPIDDGDIIKNGEFICREWPWSLENREGAQASWEIISYDRLSDTTAAEVQIETSTGTFWHVQLKQNVSLISGHTYEISFMAEVENEKDIEIGLQQREEPFETYWSAPVIISGIIDTSFTWESDITDPQTEFKFSVGDNTQTIVIDAVKIIDKDWEIPVVSVDKHVPHRAQKIELHQNYPNPFNPKTIIKYELPITNDVDLSIYNLIGQKVATLVNERQSVGNHQVKWDASGFPSGVYYYQILTDDFRKVKKMILIR